MDDLKEIVNNYFGLIFNAGLILVILATFFFFTNLTSESYETPKFVVLLIFTGLLLLFLTFKFIVSGKVTILRTPLDIPLLLLLTVGIVSTFLSPSPYVGLLGNQMKIHGSLVSLIVYVLFYFILVNNLKNLKEVKWIVYLSLGLSQILAILSLLAYWGVGLDLTPTGSSFSTTAILAMLLPFMVMGILKSSKPLPITINSIFLALSGVTIALTGTWATWIAAVFGLVLSGFINNLGNLSNLRNLIRINPISLIGLIGSISLISLITILSFIPPVGSVKNPFYTQAQNFPREIQLGALESWKISVSSFRDAPFWGTGPSTYLFNFTNYKPVEFNSSKVWNLRFDSAFNEYLQILATLGGIGIVALLSFTALFVSAAYKIISETIHLRSEEMQLHLGGVKVALAVSGLTFFVLLALHSSTLPLWVVGLLILAGFMAVSQENTPSLSWFKPGLNGNRDFKNIFLQIAGNVGNINPTEETIRKDALPGILLTIALTLVLFSFFFGGKIILADYHHRLALNAVSQNNGVLAYNELVIAEKLNPYSDLYRTDLAQTNFALANAIAAAKGPTEASPAGSLTDQDKQNIQVLLQQSINEGRTAVTLSPKSVINWEILAQLYRQIAGVAQNALQFSLDSYGRAIFQDPLNPVLRVNVGGVYYAIKSYDLAIRFFSDSINLKPDFPNGYYNLSVALRDKGDLANAQAMAEKLVTLVDQASPDYKTATDYLNDLKAKTGGPAEPPAATASGDLQDEKLPKVVNLPKPEKIATPAAIKKPNPTPKP